MRVWFGGGGGCCIVEEEGGIVCTGGEDFGIGGRAWVAKEALVEGSCNLVV